MLVQDISALVGSTALSIREVRKRPMTCARVYHILEMVDCVSGGGTNRGNMTLYCSQLDIKTGSSRSFGALPFRVTCPTVQEDSPWLQNPLLPHDHTVYGGVSYACTRNRPRATLAKREGESDTRNVRNEWD